MMIALYIVAGLFLIVVGVIIGYWISHNDQKKDKAKVARMGDHELFMRRHGLKK